MDSTVEIDDGLLAAAMGAGGSTSAIDTVHEALQLYLEARSAAPPHGPVSSDER